MEIQGHLVSIEGDNDTVEQALSSSIFSQWVDSMDPRFVIRKITIQAVDMFGPRVGFIKFRADVVDPDGNFVPGAVFMRGGAVAILVVLECEDTEYVLLTSQARFSIGRFGYLETPAGMLDGSGNVSGVAIKELQEETGIAITLDELVDLTGMYTPSEPGAFPSVGGTDEFIRLFLYRNKVSKAFLEDLQGRLGGLEHEGERISLKVLPFTSAFSKVSDMKFLSAAALYVAALQERRI